MIPSMIVLGLVLGRWPRTALLLAALGWPVTLLTGGVLEQVSDVAAVLLGAAALGLANAGVGVLAYRALRWPVRLVGWLAHPAR